MGQERLKIPQTRKNLSHIMPSAWNWIRDFYQAAARDGDAERLKLIDYHSRGFEVGHERPDERLAIYDAGRALAARLNEPWWEMFFEHWKIETLLFSKQDARGALDLAARAVVEVAKPNYANLPERASLNLNLVSAYMQLDPIGYAEKIRAAFGYIRESCVMYDEFAPYHAQQWTSFLEAVGDDAATPAAWEHLRLADESDSDHYRMGALLLLCKVLCQKEPQTARAILPELAAHAERCAINEGRERALASALMWRAVGARWDGDERGAQQWYRRAFAIQNRMNTPKNAVGYAAIVYHEANREWDEALRVAQNELRVLRAHKLRFQEAKLRFKKCELLKRAGRDWTREAARLRAVAASLPSQSHWENKLSQLARA